MHYGIQDSKIAAYIRIVIIIENQLNAFQANL